MWGSVESISKHKKGSEALWIIKNTSTVRTRPMPIVETTGVFHEIRQLSTRSPNALAVLRCQQKPSKIQAFKILLFSGEIEFHILSLNSQVPLQFVWAFNSQLLAPRCGEVGGRLTWIKFKTDDTQMPWSGWCGELMQIKQNQTWQHVMWWEADQMFVQVETWTCDHAIKDYSCLTSASLREADAASLWLVLEHDCLLALS